MASPSVNYRDILIESLKDQEEALDYLNFKLSNYDKDDEIGELVLLFGIENILLAYEDFSHEIKTDLFRLSQLFQVLKAPKFKACMV